MDVCLIVRVRVCLCVCLFDCLRLYLYVCFVCLLYSVFVIAFVCVVSMCAFYVSVRMYRCVILFYITVSLCCDLPVSVWVYLSMCLSLRKAAKPQHIHTQKYFKGLTMTRAVLVLTLYML